MSVTRDAQTGVTTTTVRKQGGTVCYVLESTIKDGTGNTIFKSASDAIVASIKQDPSRASVWAVTCEGKTGTLDTSQSPCKEALRIPGAAGCTSGGCK
jgi:hypothetical protein